MRYAIDPFITLRLLNHDAKLQSNSYAQLDVRKLPEGVTLSPEERVVLFHIVRKYHADGPEAVEWSVHLIARLSDSNIASVGSLLKKLKQSELVAQNITGRTSHASREPNVLTTDFLHLLRPRQPSFIEPKLQPLQKKILFPEEGFNAGKQKRGGFSRSNRWLLCVLLEFADHLGVVHCLSNPLLMSLTGMTRTRLRTQLQHLQCLGFLHSVSPGTKNKNFMGTQLPVYHLNIMHPYFKADRTQGITLLMRYQDIDHYNEFTDTERLRLIQDRITRVESPVVSLESVKQLNFFKVKDLTGIRHESADFLFLEGLISRLATEVLNEHWAKLDSTSVELSDIHLYQSIQTGLASEFDNDTESLLLCKERLKAITSIATLRAREIYRRINHIPGKYKLDFSDYDLVVLPVGYVLNRPRFVFVAELLPKNTTNKSSTDYKCIEQTLKNREISFEEHKELTADLRNSFCFIDAAVKQKAIDLGDPVFVGYQRIDPVDVADENSQLNHPTKLNFSPTDSVGEK